MDRYFAYRKYDRGEFNVYFSVVRPNNGEYYYIKDNLDESNKVQTSFDGYDESIIYLNYYLCKDSTCQDK